ncbi:MAG TPA: protein DpdD [Ktedonobacteraceae bacterium]|nr:protein DpdD [Ktedonobacteraceae bacterium]
MQVTFTNQGRYDFAQEFLRLFAVHSSNTEKHPEQLMIEVKDTVFGKLLQRIEEQQSIILPDLTGKTSRWLIAGSDLQQLETTFTRVQHFLVPTYAQLAENLRSFDSKSDYRLQYLGASLFPVGYYVLTSRKEDVATILKKLDVWMRLEKERPHIEPESHYTYGTLYQRFKLALASGQWQEAEDARRKIQALNLTSTDNVLFLEIEYLAQQQRWSELGKREDFALLARMRITRAVRGALLTAFHQTYLLPLQQQGKWAKALDEFRVRLPMLGLLLTGRLGLTQSAVVQMYAYQAAFERDRAALTALMQVNKEQETIECIAQLLLLLGPEIRTVVIEPSLVTRSPLALARESLNDGDYDTATRYALEMQDVGEQTALLMQIAFQTCDASLAAQSLLAYWELSGTEQQQLRHRFRVLNVIIEPLQTLVDATNPKEQPIVQELLEAEHLIENWLAWFDRAKTQPDDPALTTSLERLDIVIDNRFWTVDNVVQLNESLLAVIMSDTCMRYSWVKNALRKLVAFFLTDEEFPRQEPVYIQLYETLYTGLLESKASAEPLSTGFILLRLADALLRQTPGRCNELYRHLEEWCPMPLPVLKNWIFEAFELFTEYGLAPGVLAPWYRVWVSSLLDRPGNHDPLDLEAWLVFAKWIQPGSDLIYRLKEALENTKEQVVENPLTNLPEGYEIGIFCLRESTARHAKELLLLHNSKLDIRLCSSEVLTEQARTLAMKADMVVLVTTCLTHALSYGIGPYLKKSPVYPQSSGSTNIVRAIVEHIVQKRM